MLKTALKKFKKRAKTWFLYMAILGLALNIFATPLQITKLTRLAGYLSLGAVLCCFLYSVIFEEANVKGLLMLAFMCITIGSLLITGSVNYDNILQVATFLELPILLFCYDKEDRNGLLHIIFVLYLAVTAYFFLFSFRSTSYNYSTFAGAFTLGYYNPNQLGLQITQAAFILLCAVSFYKDIRIKAIFLGAVVVCAYLIYKTLSRTCLLVLAFGVFVFLLKKFIKIKPIIVLLVFLVPIAMALFLLFGEGIYSKISFLGDNFDTGRKELYELSLRKMTFLKYLFGNAKIHQFKNDHNAYLTVFANFGAIGFCVYFGFMMHCLMKMLRSNPLPYQTTAVIGILVLILHSSMESALVMNGPIVGMPFFLLYLIANTTEKKGLKGFHKRAHNLF